MTEPCPKCKGSGMVVTCAVLVNAITGRNYPEREAVCPRCKGTGEYVPLDTSNDRM